MKTIEIGDNSDLNLTRNETNFTYDLTTTFEYLFQVDDWCSHMSPPNITLQKGKLNTPPKFVGGIIHVKKTLLERIRYSLNIGGPALMAQWSKTLPLTATCLSPLSGFESHPGHVRKLPVTYGVMGWFSPGTAGFLPLFTTGWSRRNRNMAEKVTIKRKFKIHTNTCQCVCIFS